MNIKNRETILQELRRLKPELEERERYWVIKTGIFGSFARNEIHRDSDVFAVLFKLKGKRCSAISWEM